MINVICDNALIEAFGGEAEFVEMRHVTAACRDLLLDVVAPVFQTPLQATLPGGSVQESAVPSPESSEAGAPKTSWLTRLKNRLRPAQRIEIA